MKISLHQLHFVYAQVNGQVSVQYLKIMDCLRGPKGRVNSPLFSHIRHLQGYDPI